MSERNIPGVSFNEIADALMGSPTPGAIGVILVGTACKGPTTPQYFDNGSLGKLIEMYGPSDPYKYKDGAGSEPAAELTLVRAARQVFEGGPPPGGVWCKRLVESGVISGMGNAMVVESFSSIIHAAEVDGITIAIGDNFLTEGTTGEWTTSTVAVGDIVKITNPIADIGEYVISDFDEAGNPDTVTLDGFSASSASSVIEYSIIRAVDDANIRFTAKYPGMWYNNTKIEVINYQDLAGSYNSGLTIIKIKIPDKLTYFDSEIDTSKTTPKVSQFRWFYKTLTFELGTPNDTVVPTASEILTVLNENIELTDLYDISLVSGSDNQDRIKDLAETDLYLSADTGGTNWSSDDSAVVPSTTISIELEDMLTKDGRILVIAGADESMAGYNNVGLAHAKTASVQGQDAERVYITGTDNYSTLALLVVALNAIPYPIGEERVVAVTPGLKVINDYYNKNYGVDYSTALDTNTTVTLSGGYHAARVAGLIASNIPDDSALFKPLGISELEFDLPRYAQKIAIKQSIIPIAKAPNGQIVLKESITTAGASSPYYDFMVRFVTDDLRYNFRLVAQGFIGKKNTPRIKNLLNTKLNNRANEYVRREILLAGFILNVESTRSQQIIGVVKITFGYQLVFYMKFLEFDLILT